MRNEARLPGAQLDDEPLMSASVIVIGKNPDNGTTSLIRGTAAGWGFVFASRWISVGNDRRIDRRSLNGLLPGSLSVRLGMNRDEIVFIASVADARDQYDC